MMSLKGFILKLEGRHVRYDTVKGMYVGAEVGYSPRLTSTENSSVKRYPP